MSSEIQQLTETWYYTQLVFVFLFSASVGSFLNVVILRLPVKGASIVSPPSHCPKCDYKLKWYDNIPMWSYVLLGGKCRKCKLPISIQYPLIELLTAALGVACFLKFGSNDIVGISWAFVFYFIFCALLVAITFIDIPYQIIPDELSLSGIVLGVAASFLTGQVHWIDSVVGAIVGYALIASISYGYFFLTKRDGMGMGDAKLLAMLAAFLGWQSIPFILLAGSIQGLIVAILAIGFGLMKKVPPLPDPDEWENGVKPEMEEEVSLRHAAIPFGPFLAAAGIEFLFFGEYYYQFLMSIGH